MVWVRVSQEAAVIQGLQDLLLQVTPWRSNTSTFYLHNTLPLIFSSRLAVPTDFPITTSTLQLHPSKYPDQGHWSQPWFSHSCTPHIQLISKSCWFYLNSVSRIQHADNLKIPGLGASLLLLYSAQQSE